MAKRCKLHRSRSELSIRPRDFVFAFFSVLFDRVRALPQPASSFQTWTKGGSPMLYILPSYHSNIHDVSTATFKAVPLARSGGIGRGILDEESTLDSSMRIPSFTVPAGHGMAILALSGPFDQYNSVNETAWLYTYPFVCASLPSIIEIVSIVPGAFEWTKTYIGNTTNSKDGGKYLGAGFLYKKPILADTTVRTFSQFSHYDTRIYSFGGLCINDTYYYGNNTSDDFSDLIIRLDHSSSSATTSMMSIDTEVHVTTKQAIPIPQAGFSLTQLPGSFSYSYGNSSQAMAIIGGYTANQQFVSLNQIAIYTAPEGTWTYMDASMSGELAMTIPTARVGHTSILSSDGTKLIVFGGWVGNIYTAAVPYMLILQIGDIEDGWSWSIPGNESEVLGARPDAFGLWAHTAILLEGNIMLVSSGFIIGASGYSRKPEQVINTSTFLYNITSETWITSYTYPLFALSNTALEESRPTPKPIVVLVCIFVGLFTMTIIIMTAYFINRRKYHIISTITIPKKRRCFDPGEVGEIDIDTIPVPPPVQRTHSWDQNDMGTDNSSFLQLYQRTPSPGDPPAIIVSEASDSLKNIEILEWNQKHNESDMASWVRSWATADVAAVTASIMEKSKRSSSYHRRKISTHSRITEATEPFSFTGVNEGDTAIQSSQYSDQVSTLSSSEIYDSPVQDYGYPVPPMLLSVAQTFEQDSPRHLRLHIGPGGISVPLPRRMAEEFAQPTIIPRDSMTTASYESHYTSMISPSATASKSHSLPTRSPGTTVFPHILSLTAPNPQRMSHEALLTPSHRPVNKPLPVTPTKSPGPALQTRIKTLRNKAGPGTFEFGKPAISDRATTSSPHMFAQETYLGEHAIKPLPLIAKEKKPTTKVERLRQIHMKPPTTPNLLRKSRPSLDDKQKSSRPSLECDYQSNSNRYHSNPDGGKLSRASLSSFKRRGAVMMSLSKSQKQRITKEDELQELVPRFTVERSNTTHRQLAPSPDVSIADAELDERVSWIMFGARRGPLRVVNSSPRTISNGTLELGLPLKDNKETDRVGLLQKNDWGVGLSR